MALPSPDGDLADALDDAQFDAWLAGLDNLSGGDDDLDELDEPADDVFGQPAEKATPEPGFYPYAPVDSEIDLELIKPQAGPQERFLASSADIVIYGGGAGGGKTFGILLEPLRHIDNPEFRGVIFRRTIPQITRPGGLRDASARLYPKFGGKLSELEWSFPSGAKILFVSMQHEKNAIDWQGTEIPFVGWDELTHFTRSQFFYLFSRGRSTSGVRPYIRATCNPDPESWVAELIAWWIGEDGLPIPERSGVVRWFTRGPDDTTVWADTADELRELYGDDIDAMSLTFIPATVFDNKILLEKDPGYLAKLKALPKVQREQLLGGNWKIKPAAGLLFRREWVTVVDAVPYGLVIVRYWDQAATEKREDNDPDWSAGCKMGKDALGRYWILHHTRFREGPKETNEAIRKTAFADGIDVRVGLAQDPGSAGKNLASQQITMLAGFDVQADRETGEKTTRFAPFSAQAEAGNVFVLRGPWNEALFNSLEGFPDLKHDDDADSVAGAFNLLNAPKSEIHFGTLGPR